MEKIPKDSIKLSAKDFKSKIKHYVKLHRELHGKCAKWEDIRDDFLTSFPEESSGKVIQEIEIQSKKVEKEEKRYGIFIGRVQPFTKGHNEIIQEIIRDGKIPIIIIGSTNKNDEKNPLSYEERVKLIRKVYPFGCKFIELPDKDNWTYWYETVKTNLENIAPIEQMTIYSHTKEVDKLNFEFKNNLYKQENYIKIFEVEGYNIKYLDEVTCSLGKTIHASDVRKSEGIAMRNLDARIYRELKEKHNWWK